jgi:PAS domain S-box-containing protein
MKNYLIYIFSLVLLTSFFAIDAENPVITTHKDTIFVKSEPNYPPFCIVNENGEADGFSVELFQAAAQAVHLQAKIAVGPWHEIKQELAVGKIDALPMVGRSPEREAIFDFTFPYHTMHGAVFTRNNNHSIQTLDNLKHRDLAVMKGDNAHEFVLRANLSDKIHTTATYDIAFQQLADGKYDAVIAQKLMGLQLLDKLGIDNVKALDIELENFNQDFSFAVREGDKDLLSLLNEGLSIVITNGTYDRLHKKWWSPIKGYGFSLKEKFLFLLPFIIAILIITAFVAIFILRSQVKKRTHKLRLEIQEHKKAEQALRNSEERFKFLSNATFEGIVVHKNGILQDVNESFLKMTGYNKLEVIGENFLEYIPQDADKQKIKRHLSLEKAEPYTITARRKNGSEFIAELEARNIWHDNEIVRIAAIRDVTERIMREKQLKQTNQELRKLKENLQKKVNKTVLELRNKDHLIIKQSRHAAMGEMIGNIAHQWRQPLAAVAAIVQDIEDAYEYKELDKKYLADSVEKTMKQLNYMSRTIDDFRNFFKPNKEKIEFSIQKIIEDTMSFVEKSFAYHNIKINFVVKKDSTIRGFSNEYSQTILNILNNSKDAILENKIEAGQIEIKVDVNQQNQSVVTIQDNGGGIPDDIVDKIFDPYFSTKEQGKGTGIGLYMAKMIIEENMKGKLLADNLQNGAVFQIIV